MAITTTSDGLEQFQLDIEEKFLINDPMEINKNDVTLFEILGEGAFGLVRRGVYKDAKQIKTYEVAVKMLKGKKKIFLVKI